MHAQKTTLADALLIVPDVHGDDRGFFQETYQRDKFAEIGIHDHFVQDNHSRSARGVLRGMHFQLGNGIAKLVRCARGEILDVIVDIRRDSPTYKRWEGFRLSDENCHELYVPIGFAHGFVTISDIADVCYKQTGYYDAQLEVGIAYNDPEIAISWPGELEVSTSARDAVAPLLRDVAETLPF